MSKSYQPATVAVDRGVRPLAQYEAWRSFYADRVTGWMALDQLRAEIGRLHDAGDTPSPELLLVHAMRLLEMAPAWQAGEPSNLVAAAADADEWLALIQRLHAAGRWRFSERDSSAKLACCRDALQRFMRPNVAGTRQTR